MYHYNNSQKMQCKQISSFQSLDSFGIIINLVRKMMKSLRLLCLLLVVCSVSSQIKKMRVLWLNNGGKIMSNYQDWITLKISTPNVDGTIECADGRGYTYTPGTTKRFSSLWFPVESHFQLTMVQYNIFSKDDATKLDGNVNTSTQIGYYTGQLSLSQFINGVTISVEYMGLGVSVSVDSYTKTADYYILMQLVNETVGNNTYGLESSCKLVKESSSAVKFVISGALLLLITMIA